ncbi:MAG: DUF1318 domain-containing protein [Chromatiales bacterium]|jgi:uncharacterized protein YdbL (DUF1318 family)
MRRLLLLASTALVATAACVTINVYFPSAEAAEAADRIIDEVRGANDNSEESAAELGVPARLRHTLAALAASALDFVVPAAHAQVDFNASSPATRSLEASLKKRFSDLKPYYQSGAIGVTREATVAIRDRNLIPLPERSRVLKLVADQNADWNALYVEIAKANNHPEWENQIRSTFAERNVAKLESGWWYQDSSGGWKQK